MTGTEGQQAQAGFADGVADAPSAQPTPSASSADVAEVAGGDEVNRVGGDSGAASAESEAAEVGSDDPSAVLQAELEEVRGRLRAVSKAFTDQKDEMASFRERVEAQSKLARQRREFEVVKTFFEPVQNLRRSVAAAGDGPLADGLRMVLKQFEDGLAKLGLEPIPGVGAAFDPNLHEALSVIPVVDEAQHNTVLFVHQEGFMVDGRPVAPAQVVVGRKEGAT
jgi:molecular chaperone GrpE